MIIAADALEGNESAVRRAAGETPFNFYEIVDARTPMKKKGCDQSARPPKEEHRGFQKQMRFPSSRRGDEERQGLLDHVEQRQAVAGAEGQSPTRMRSP
jgi:hypothetical protein